MGVLDRIKEKLRPTSSSSFVPITEEQAREIRLPPEMERTARKALDEMVAGALMDPFRAVQVAICFAVVWRRANAGAPVDREMKDLALAAANAMKGTDALPPPWEDVTGADIRRCLKNLESYSKHVQGNSVTWVCRACERVVGFASLPPPSPSTGAPLEESRSLAALLQLLFVRVDVRCPGCGSNDYILVDAGMLATTIPLPSTPMGFEG